MKKFLFICCSFFLLLACESDPAKEELIVEDPMVGEWQLVEQNVSNGGPSSWQDVENGDTFKLNEDGTFEDFQLFSECSTGNYLATEDELTLTYDCTDTKPFTYFLKKEGEDIILSPKTVICFESCEYKYRMISQ